MHAAAQRAAAYVQQAMARLQAAVFQKLKLELTDFLPGVPNNRPVTPRCHSLGYSYNVVVRTCIHGTGGSVLGLPFLGYDHDRFPVLPDHSDMDELAGVPQCFRNGKMVSRNL